MAEAALKAEIWIKAQIRICDLNFLPAVVTRRGDSDAGAVLLKLNRLGAGTEVLTQARDPDGQRAWMRGTGEGLVPEPDADAFIAKQVRYDPDIWVLEIEDPKRLYKVEGKII
ncbi:MAG: DUF1491 family protein [Rhodospirillales bacterium]|nr:DUF1491 family protein [Rhodospirillales bacterium]